MIKQGKSLFTLAPCMYKQQEGLQAKQAKHRSAQLPKEKQKKKKKLTPLLIPGMALFDDEYICGVSNVILFRIGNRFKLLLHSNTKY